MEKHLFDFLEQYMPLSEQEKKAIVDLDVIRSYEEGTVLVEEGDVMKGGFVRQLLFSLLHHPGSMFSLWQ